MPPETFTFILCCDKLSEATSKGSDNEMWGCAMHFNATTKDFTLGCVNGAKYCPFCGKKPKVVKVKV